jgi:hypothetical protein
MGSDSCFRIGSNHTVCQDYAASGHDGLGHPYAIVSDGCSGSPHTDYGARFLVQAARLQLEGKIAPGAAIPGSDPAFASLEWNAILPTARMMAMSAHLSRQCLDATLIRAMIVGLDVWVHQAGDGVVAARRRGTGKLEFSTRRFGENMPYYLSYRLDSREEVKYFDTARSYKQVVGCRSRETLEPPVPSMWSVNQGQEMRLERHMLVDEMHFPVEIYDLVFIMTDGAESFQDASGEPVPLTSILDELFDIKSYSGEFIARRCNRFLGRVCAERGWKHSDDLAVAGIHLP